MASGIRTIVCLQHKVYRALKVKAATTDRSLSDLVNAAVLESLREDALDLEAFDRRAKGPSRPFEKVHKAIHQEGADLNRRKKLKRLKALTGTLHLDNFAR